MEDQQTDEAEADLPRANRAEPLSASLARIAEMRAKNPALREEPPKLSLVAYEAPPPKVTITKKQLAKHLISLAVIYPPRNAMTEEELTMRMQLFFDALRGLSDAELETACKRYWQDPENRFFPHPGALLHLARK